MIDESKLSKVVRCLPSSAIRLLKLVQSLCGSREFRDVYKNLPRLFDTLVYTVFGHVSVLLMSWSAKCDLMGYQMMFDRSSSCRFCCRCYCLLVVQGPNFR